jgi:hypothetical protein
MDRTPIEFIGETDVNLLGGTHGGLMLLLLGGSGLGFIARSAVIAAILRRPIAMVRTEHLKALLTEMLRKRGTIGVMAHLEIYYLVTHRSTLNAFSLTMRGRCFCFV